MIKRKLIEEKPFEFSARVTLQLGRESISSSTVAISELIKNAYDADAEFVDIDFHLRNHSVSTLIIKDTGSGMNEKMLAEHWLKIGTDNKTIIEKSGKKERTLTGAKGLGRLGIDRLCKKLILYTKTEGMDKAIQLNIDWKQFENTKKTLSEIKHKIYEVELPVRDKYGDIFLDETSSGTRMVLVGLKDKWTTDFVDILENELRLLTSPFESKNDFNISLNVTNNSVRTSKSLSSAKILQAARWEAKASVDAEGIVHLKYIKNHSETPPIEYSVPWSTWLKNAGETPLFGPIKFDLYYLAQDTTSFKKLDLDVTDFRQFMRLNQGVRLYRDHFRVRPYGEPTGKGDWLDIGLRKASSPGGLSQSGWKIGPNQIIGAVTISRETNSVLNDQANREGLVENTAFFQLRTFLLKVIDILESLVQKDAKYNTTINFTEELAKILEESNKEISAAIEGLKKTVSAIQKNNKSRKKRKKNSPLNPSQIVAQRLAELEALREKQSAAEQRYLEALSSEKNELQEQKNTLSNLASIGILTISFGHEVRQHSALALNGTTRALAALRKATGVDDIVATPIEYLEIAKDGAKYVDNFSKFAIENIKPDKRTRRKVNIANVFAYIFNIFSITLEKMKISVEVNLSSPDANYEVFAFEIDWESIVINFLTNSIWAIEASTNRENAKIVVDIKESESEIVVSYKDSGIGLEVGTEEDIFSPMQSGKRDLKGNTVGTGMGLAIVKAHVENHMNGKVIAKSTSDLGGAEFVITIPVRGAKK